MTTTPPVPFIPFSQFEQDLTALNARVGLALASAMKVDNAPDETDRAAAFALLLGDFYYLLQWLWKDCPSFSAVQGQWIAEMETWMDRVRGEEASDISVKGRMRLWYSMLRSDDYIQQLQEILQPCPRSVALLRDHDALEASAHAQDAGACMLQFAQRLIPPDAVQTDTRFEELKAMLETQGAASPTAAVDDVQGSADLAQTLAELDQLVGLANVKAEVLSLVNLLRINQLRQQRGLPQLDVTRHMVFYGGPGTGKTTVARLLARIFKSLGVLKKGHLVETDRSGLVAAYVGQTALKVKRVVNQADEGVLFIDEAYALVRGENDFGGEAIETLLKLMEDRRESLVVIVAGYTDRMQAFIQSNPGLKSRFTRYFNFEDYDAAQLCDILMRIASRHGMHLTSGAVELAATLMKDERNRHVIESGNARFVRNCFEKATMAQADRLSAAGSLDTLSDAQLMTLQENDLRWAIAESLRELG